MIVLTIYGLSLDIDSIYHYVYCIIYGMYYAHTPAWFIAHVLYQGEEWNDYSERVSSALIESVILV